jgi:hypothetical protein
MATGLLRRVTGDEILAFNRDGAVLLKGMLGQYWIDLLAEGLEYAHDHPDGMSAGVGERLRIDQFPASHSTALKKLVEESPVAEIVGTILDAPPA